MAPAMLWPSRRAAWKMAGEAREDAMQRRGLMGIMASATMAGLVGQARAQSWPARPVRVLIGYGPGGLGDVTTRLIAEKLAEKLGRAFVIENRPGAGGILASQMFLQSPADGYTLMMAATGNVAMTPGLFRSVPFDPVADFAPICLTCLFGFAVAVRADAPMSSIADLVAVSRRSPNTLNFATISAGSAQHVGTEFLKAMAGIQATTVPFRTTGEVISALQGGQAQVTVEAIASLLPHVESGALKLLAVTTPQRHPQLPNVPTAKEQGLTEYEVTSWNGLVARVGTPAPVIELVNAEMNEALRQPDLRQRFRNLGVEPGGGTPAEFGALIRTDVARWREAIRLARIEQQ
jgi:tripartite-type tricarboxylate transporter receptor subunit TctC